MTVRDAMNTVVVTVSPDHTLREAARRMTHRSVGAAVVVGGTGHSPGIITERDVLRSIGHGGDIDEELVRDHLSPELIYAYADWPLETAAAKMTAGDFRHVIVMDRAGAALAILSMRDIVRCWMSGGSQKRVPSEPTTA